MKFHKQRYRHRPERGEYGDCCRTCWACLFDLDPEDVPNFGEAYDDVQRFIQLEREWLNSQGYTSFSIGYTGTLEQVLASTTMLNCQTPVLLTGTSRSGCNHVVIAQDGKIIHDTSLDDAGIIGPASDGLFWLEVPVPLSLGRAPQLREAA